MAMALHIPNWCCVNPSRCPIAGNRINATELSRNTTPSDTEISFSEASTAGATAAIALPPQIAVPEATRCDDLRGIRSQRPTK